MKRGMAENIGYAATPVPNGSKTPSWIAFPVKSAMVASRTSFLTLPFRDMAVHAFGDLLNGSASALTVAIGTGSVRGVVR